MNDTDKYICLRKGHQVGTLTEVDQVEVGEASEPDTRESATADPEVSQVRRTAIADPQPDTNTSLPHGKPGGNDQEISLEELEKAIPDKLKDLYARSRENLEPDQVMELAKILSEYEDIFAAHDLDLGCFSNVTHRIDTDGARPFKMKMRRTAWGFEQEEERHLEKLLDAGVITPSNSEWASTPVLVRKKDGSVRWCLDFRRLNDLTIKDAFPLPLIEDCLDALAGTQFFT